MLRVEIEGDTVLETNDIEQVKAYVDAHKLMTATPLENIAQFNHIAMSADGDSICGFVFNDSKGSDHA